MKLITCTLPSPVHALYHLCLPQTLHDLMDEQEIEKLQLDTQALSAADEKRKRFEEKLQREKELRERKREIMMRKEKEYEQVRSDIQ